MSRKLPPRKGKVIKKQEILLVDGNALYKRGFIGAKNQYNSEGKPIGGIYQFLTVLRKLLIIRLPTLFLEGKKWIVKCRQHHHFRLVSRPS